MPQPEASPSDAQLMAFVDGELPPHEAAWVASRVDADPDAARRLTSFSETRRRLVGVARAQDAIPDALMGRIADTIAAHDAARDTDTVIALTPRRRSAPIWAVPLAASVALAVGLGLGLTADPDRPPAPFEALTSAQAQAALDTALTGETVELDSGALRILSTFRSEAAGLCREATLSPGTGAAALAVLCRGSDGAWAPELAVRHDTDPAGFGVASGASVVDAFLDDVAAGPPLDPDAEARALAE